MFLVGETPSRQLLPAMRWLRAEHGVRRWCIVGNDYVWPRGTAAAAHRYAPLCDGQICDEVFVPLGTTAFADVVRRVEHLRADAVLMLLVGQDAVEFNRAFARAGLQDGCRRLSTLIEENTLLASGADSTQGICAAAAYFESLVTPESLDFGGRYARRFGARRADAQQPGGVVLRGHPAARGAGARGPGRRRRGALRGRRLACPTRARAARCGCAAQHLDQRVYLAEADALDLDVIAQLQPVPAG